MKDFSVDIFPEGSKLGISYFNKDSISTAHLELICKHYHVPMDYFFDDMPHPSATFNGDYNINTNQVGNGNVNHVHAIESLKEDNERLKTELENKKKDVEWYKNRIEWLEDLIKSLKK